MARRAGSRIKAIKRYFEGFRPDVVVFYDGGNEPAKCRIELDAFFHAREGKIRTVLREASSENPESFQFLVLPIKNFIEKAIRVLGSQGKTTRDFFDCHKNDAKTEMIARVLLSDWRMVKDMVESYGGQFICILQPLAYFSKMRLDHIKLDEGLGEQYEAVYKKTVNLLASDFAVLKENFLDLRQALDKDEYI